MKKHLFVIALIPALIYQGQALAKEADSALGKIKTQIQILNLLNGLELNREQMQLILDAARQAKGIFEAAKEKIAQEEGKMTSAYSEVLKTAQAGSLVIPEDIASRVHKINQKIDKIKETAQEKITALVTKIRDNLEPHQLYALNEYKPCIIPPVKKGRIGQADDPSGFARVLERVRTMPVDKYRLRRDSIAQKAIDKVKTKVPVGFILDEEKLKTQLFEAMDRVRAMPDVEFALKKEEIAKDIKAQLLPEKQPTNIGVKIERLLLDPEIIPLLEQRLARA